MTNHPTTDWTRDPMPREIIQLRLFWRHVGETDSGCWQWIGKVSGNGYGYWSFNGRQTLAHRAAYYLLVGPIPDGLTIDHLCRNKLCVNPAHLEAVTQQINTLRGTSPTARNKVKTHCKYGHELTGANVEIRKDGRGRQCRTCHREAARRQGQQIRAS